MVRMVDTDVPTLVPPTLYRPTWADPGFVLSTNQFTTTDFVLIGATAKMVAKNNPKRWALGFALLVAGPNVMKVGPWPDLSVVGMSPPSGQSYMWFSLFEFGPIVCAEWSGLVNVGATLRVIEVTV